KKIVNVSENITRVINIIKRYIAYYVFLSISFFYTGSESSFISNLMEFSKNQSTLNFKIANFFNSENNATVIKLTKLMHNIISLLTMDEKKQKVILKNTREKEKYMDTFTFLNELGQEFVQNNFVKFLKKTTNTKSENKESKKEENDENLL